MRIRGVRVWPRGVAGWMTSHSVGAEWVRIFRGVCEGFDPSGVFVCVEFVSEGFADSDG